MNEEEKKSFWTAYQSVIGLAVAEIEKVDLSVFPRVRIVIEFEAPDKAAMEIRKRRPWK